MGRHSLTTKSSQRPFWMFFCQQLPKPPTFSLPFSNVCNNLLNMIATCTSLNLFSNGLSKSMTICFSEEFNKVTLRIWEVQECNSSMSIRTLTSRIWLSRSSFSTKMISKLKVQMRDPLRSLIQSTKAPQIKTSASTRSMSQSRTWNYPTRLSGKP